MSIILKQVIVMRTDLKMDKGKMIAQGSHASMKVVLENLMHPWIIKWTSQAFTKIVVKVHSLEQMEEIFHNAKAADIPVAWITDAGRTTFNGVPTDTCIAVGPAPYDVINPITGGLKLL